MSGGLAPILDRPAIEGLIEDLGRVGTASILHTFLRDAGDRIAELASAAADDAARHVHSLKSSAASVGAARLAQHARELEARLRTEGGALGPADVETLGEALAAFRATSEIAVLAEGATAAVA
jgi:HPt (histidine-containing phosphotransfer) domain-containing protein